MFGKSAASITDYIVKTNTFAPEHCISLLRGTLKKKAEDVVASIDGVQMTDAQKLRARMVLEHYDFVVNHIRKLDEAIDRLLLLLKKVCVALYDTRC